MLHERDSGSPLSHEQQKPHVQQRRERAETVEVAQQQIAEKNSGIIYLAASALRAAFACSL